MARLALLLLSLLSLAASYNPFSDELTTQIVRDYVSKTLTNPFFSRFILSEVKQQLNELIAPENDAELQNLVDLFNEYRTGNMNQLPRSSLEALALLKAKAPKSYERAKSLFDMLLDKFNNLTKEGKDFYSKLEKAYYKTMMKKPNLKQHVMNQVQLTVQWYDKYTQLSPETKQAFKTEFPEVIAFVESPYFQGTIALMREGLKNGNVEKIVQSLMASWKGVVQQHNDSSATGTNSQTGIQQEGGDVHTQVETDGGSDTVQTQVEDQATFQTQVEDQATFQTQVEDQATFQTQVEAQ